MAYSSLLSKLKEQQRQKPSFRLETEDEKKEIILKTETEESLEFLMEEEPAQEEKKETPQEQEEAIDPQFTDVPVTGNNPAQKQVQIEDLKVAVTETAKTAENVQADTPKKEKTNKTKTVKDLAQLPEMEIEVTPENDEEVLEVPTIKCIVNTIYGEEKVKITVLEEKFKHVTVGRASFAANISIEDLKEGAVCECLRMNDGFYAIIAVTNEVFTVELKETNEQFTMSYDTFVGNCYVNGGQEEYLNNAALSRAVINNGVVIVRRR